MFSWLRKISLSLWNILTITWMNIWLVEIFPSKPLFNHRFLSWFFSTFCNSRSKSIIWNHFQNADLFTHCTCYDPLGFWDIHIYSRSHFFHWKRLIYSAWNKILLGLVAVILTNECFVALTFRMKSIHIFEEFCYFMEQLWYLNQRVF